MCETNIQHQQKKEALVKGLEDKSAQLSAEKFIEIVDSVQQLNDEGTLFSCYAGTYLVLTDDEAEDMYDEHLDEYIDDVILPQITESYRHYFDVEQWKHDASFDGRGVMLAPYDNNEIESGDYYIYRIS